MLHLLILLFTLIQRYQVIFTESIIYWPSLKSIHLKCWTFSNFRLITFQWDHTKTVRTVPRSISGAPFWPEGRHWDVLSPTLVSTKSRASPCTHTYSKLACTPTQIILITGNLLQHRHIRNNIYILYYIIYIL